VKKLGRIYQFINVLSLDVVAGAMVSALFFARIFKVQILPWGVLALGLTVWTIYTTDHLVDAKRVNIPLSSETFYCTGGCPYPRNTDRWGYNFFYQKTGSSFRVGAGGRRCHLYFVSAKPQVCKRILRSPSVFYWSIASRLVAFTHRHEPFSSFIRRRILYYGTL